MGETIFFFALPSRYLWRRARKIINLLLISPSIPLPILDSLSLFCVYIAFLVYFITQNCIVVIQFILILCKLFVILSNKHVIQTTITVRFPELDFIALPRQEKVVLFCQKLIKSRLHFDYMSRFPLFSSYCHCSS